MRDVKVLWDCCECCIGDPFEAAERGEMDAHGVPCPLCQTVPSESTACLFCGKPITTTVFKGTGFCCGLCAKQAQP